MNVYNYMYEVCNIFQFSDCRSRNIMCTYHIVYF